MASVGLGRIVQKGFDMRYDRSLMVLGSFGSMTAVKEFDMHPGVWENSSNATDNARNRDRHQGYGMTLHRLV